MARTEGSSVASLGLGPRIVGIPLVIVCFAAINGGVAAAQQTNATVTEKTVLRGTVVNAITHEPIGRAVVTSSDGRFATMTNERGRFEMVFKLKKNVPPGGVTPGAGGGTEWVSSGASGTTSFSNGADAGVQAQTTVDRPDFLTARRVKFLNLQTSATTGVAVARDQEEVTISLTPEAKVVGHVTLADGEGARGMQVALYRRTVQNGQSRWAAAGQAEVKSDGEFRIADVESGEYKLFSLELNDQDAETSNPLGQQFGYPPDYYPGTSDFGRGALIHLAAGETFQAMLTPERRPYYRVRIGVVNVPSGAVTQVEVWKDGHPGPGYSLGYDFRDGSIGGMLPDGSYFVKVTSQTNNLITGVMKLSVKGGPAGGAVTMVGGTVVDVRMTEEFGNSEQAQQIREAENRPRQQGGDQGVPQRRLHRGTYIQLMLWSAEEFTFPRQLMAQPPSDPEAEGLEIQNVPAGEYRVQVQTPVGYVASVRCGGTDLQNSNLVIGAGAALPAIEVVLRDDSAEVDGSVTDVAIQSRGTGSGVVPGTAAGFAYFVPVRDGGEVRMAAVQPDGSFQVVQLTPGTYRVLAFDRPKPDLEFSNEDAMRRYDAQTITVEPGQKRQIRVSLTAE
jgi:hypothetical protein